MIKQFDSASYEQSRQNLKEQQLLFAEVFRGDKKGDNEKSDSEKEENKGI